MNASDQPRNSVTAPDTVELDRRVARSVRVYDTSFLNGYDLFVHGFCNKYAWQCPTDTLVAQYRRLTRKNHLEAGVGTGFLIDKTALKENDQRLAILDFSVNCLDYSKKRLARYSPELFHHDILKPIKTDARKFDSIGINYVLHCVPGSFARKGAAFDNLKQLLNPDGVFFGSTLLGSEVPRNITARALMGLYNRVGAFSNAQDSESTLRASLKEHFDDVSIEIAGCCALFECR